MAHESFEDPDDRAPRSTRHFVAVKVDREERPDVDAIYMAATQALTGHGGWPMTVFLPPDGEPFFAGTYFPPTDRHGLAGLPRLLAALAEAWTTRRDEVEAQAESLGDASAREARPRRPPGPRGAALDLRAAARRAARRMRRRASTRRRRLRRRAQVPASDYARGAARELDGPRRRAPRWPRTLDAMAPGGLYDHVGGGFARYSVDARWRVPHFEKMLYDQALLARAYLAADRARGGGTPWREVALARSTSSERDCAWATATPPPIDADAGGVEGAHVTWTLARGRRRADGRGPRAATWPRPSRAGALGEDDLDGRSVPRLGDGEPLSHRRPRSSPRSRAARRARARARRRPSTTRSSSSGTRCSPSAMLARARRGPHRARARAARRAGAQPPRARRLAPHRHRAAPRRPTSPGSPTPASTRSRRPATTAGATRRAAPPTRCSPTTGTARCRARRAPTSAGASSRRAGG